MKEIECIFDNLPEDAINALGEMVKRANILIKKWRPQTQYYENYIELLAAFFVFCSKYKIDIEQLQSVRLSGNPGQDCGWISELIIDTLPQYIAKKRVESQLEHYKLLFERLA